MVQESIIELVDAAFRSSARRSTGSRGSVDSMARGGKRPGAGRPREVGGERTVTRSIKLADPDDTAELAALVEDGHGTTESDAIRHLIRESARRRARRAR